MKNLSIKYKNRVKVLAGFMLASIILVLTACSSEKPQPYAFTTEDTALQSAITENLKAQFETDSVSVEMVKSAKDEKAVIINIIFDDSALDTRKSQNENFYKTFDTVKSTENSDKIESLHVNYTSGETLYAIYDLPLFNEATSDNLEERVTILDLETTK